MNHLAIYLHGQGISDAQAQTHATWIENETGFVMRPLMYHGIIEDWPLDVLGIPLRPPEVTPAERRVYADLADVIQKISSLNSEVDDPNRFPTLDLTGATYVRVHAFETWRSSLRYLVKHEIRNEIQADLHRQIDVLVKRVAADQDELIELTLVAHSLGSVIALDLLKSPHPQARFRQFVSLGSPLGLISAAPGSASAFLLPEEVRNVSCPWHDFATDGDLLATIARVSGNRGFSATPLVVSTLLGEVENPHESYFLDPVVARQWVTVCINS